MPSLVERLQKTQARAPESLPDFPQYSIEEMDNMKVDFRAKHLGRQFLEVWTNDQPWIMWFLKHHGSSPKVSHRVMTYYIECKIERAELEGRQIHSGQGSPFLGFWEALCDGQSQDQSCSHANFRDACRTSRTPRVWNMDDVELIGRWSCRPRTNTWRCARAHWSQQSMPSSSTSSRFQAPAHLNAETGGSQ